VKFGSRADKLGLESGYRITALEVPNPRPAKEWMFIPAFLLLAFVALLQQARRRRSLAVPVAAG
jgi:hypothetical protein